MLCQKIELVVWTIFDLDMRFLLGKPSAYCKRLIRGGECIH